MFCIEYLRKQVSRSCSGKACDPDHVEVILCTLDRNAWPGWTNLEFDSDLRFALIVKGLYIYTETDFILRLFGVLSSQVVASCCSCVANLVRSDNQPPSGVSFGLQRMISMPSNEIGLRSRLTSTRYDCRFLALSMSVAVSCTTHSNSRVCESTDISLRRIQPGAMCTDLGRGHVGPFFRHAVVVSVLVDGRCTVTQAMSALQQRSESRVADT